MSIGTGPKQMFAGTLTQVDTEAIEDLGTHRYEGGKLYKYVELKNATATVAVVAGDVVAYFAETGHQNSRVVSDKTDAGAVPVAAGIVLATIAATLAVSYFCWIQIKGPATLNTAIGGSAADGHMLVPGTTDKALEKFVLTEGTPNVIATPIAAIALDASAKIVALDCPY